MTWTYTAGASDRDNVRLLIMDTDAAHPIFTDEELDAMLLLESADVKCGAALALETMASNEAFVQKVIRILDLSTNGAQTAMALLARAKLLREQSATSGGGFEIAELVYDDFSYREHLFNEALRSG